MGPAGIYYLLPDTMCCAVDWSGSDPAWGHSIVRSQHSTPLAATCNLYSSLSTECPANYNEFSRQVAARTPTKNASWRAASVEVWDRARSYTATHRNTQQRTHRTNFVFAWIDYPTATADSRQHTQVLHLINKYFCPNCPRQYWSCLKPCITYSLLIAV